MPQEGTEQAALAALQEAVRDTDEAEARLQASQGGPLSALEGVVCGGGAGGRNSIGPQCGHWSRQTPAMLRRRLRTEEFNLCSVFGKIRARPSSRQGQEPADIVSHVASTARFAAAPEPSPAVFCF